MFTFKVFPIPDEVTRRIRESRIDDFGHRLSISVATENDTGPCRSCLTVICARRRTPSLLVRAEPM